MARESQYVEQYLSGPAYTVNTFIKYTVRGRAARYAGKYVVALRRSLQRRSDVVPVRSIRGGIAYRKL